MKSFYHWSPREKRRLSAHYRRHITRTRRAPRWPFVRTWLQITSASMAFQRCDWSVTLATSLIAIATLGISRIHLDMNRWINENIRQRHGPLGAACPQSGYDPSTPGALSTELTDAALVNITAIWQGCRDLEAVEAESMDLAQPWVAQFGRHQFGDGVRSGGTRTHGERRSEFHVGLP